MGFNLGAFLVKPAVGSAAGLLGVIATWLYRWRMHQKREPSLPGMVTVFFGAAAIPLGLALIG